MDDCPHDGPEPIDAYLALLAAMAEPREARPVAVCVNGQMVWTEADKESPAEALSRYFARIVPAVPEPVVKAPSPNAKPALPGLTRIASGARKGPGWCSE